MKIAIVYGSTTGNTQDVAERLAKLLADVGPELFDISKLGASDLREYDVLIAGVPTWNIGELQEDWESVYDALDSVDLSGTRIVVFGLGDAIGYPDFFQDAMGMLYEELLKNGATGGFGFTSTEGYEFSESRAVLDGHPNQFCGLALDNDNTPELTDNRIAAWVGQIRKELGLQVVTECGPVASS